MAEAIGVAGSIIAILRLTGVVVRYLNDVKDASKDCSKLMVEISCTSGILLGLKAVVESLEAEEAAWYTTIRSLDASSGPLNQLSSTLERLSKHLKPLVGLRKAGRSLIWPFKKGEIKGILERQKTLLTLALQNDHL